MLWDGINRHFLVIDIDPAAGNSGGNPIRNVEVVRVD